MCACSRCLLGPWALEPPATSAARRAGSSSASRAADSASLGCAWGFKRLEKFVSFYRCQRVSKK